MAELVGILNITPDSFSDGGRHNSLEAAVKHAEAMFAAGAALVDVGAESTRPGAAALAWREEIERLAGLVERASALNWRISLDTYHPETVRWASGLLSELIINDVTGCRDPVMRQTVASTGQKVIVGHLPAASRDVQAAHAGQPLASVRQVVEDLHAAVERLARAGVAHDNIIVDPGIGFGKTRELNWELLEFARQMPDYEVMIGYSRKRFLGERRLEIETNRTAGRIAIAAGAKYLRVHDVRGHATLI